MNLRAFISGEIRIARRTAARDTAGGRPRCASGWLRRAAMLSMLLKDFDAERKRIALLETPDAYCVKLADGSGYIIWPGKVGTRGYERAAIGLGKTARKAWASVQLTGKAN